MPGYEMTEDEMKAKKYLVFTPRFYDDATYPTMTKFLDQVNRVAVNDNSYRPIMVYRFAETYLIAAEAALMKSSVDQTKANTYLHEVRKRANPAVTQVTATVDLVLKERRKELIGEGHRYYDLGRLGRTIDRNTSDNKLPGNSEYVTVDPWNRGGDQYQVILPISQSQRTANPAAVQNPGYPD